MSVRKLAEFRLRVAAAPSRSSPVAEEVILDEVKHIMSSGITTPEFLALGEPEDIRALVRPDTPLEAVPSERAVQVANFLRDRAQRSMRVSGFIVERNEARQLRQSQLLLSSRGSLEEASQRAEQFMEEKRQEAAAKSEKVASKQAIAKQAVTEAVATAVVRAEEILEKSAQKNEVKKALIDARRDASRRIWEAAVAKSEQARSQKLLQIEATQSVVKSNAEKRDELLSRQQEQRKEVRDELLKERQSRSEEVRERHELRLEEAAQRAYESASACRSFSPAWKAERKTLRSPVERRAQAVQEECNARAAQFLETLQKKQCAVEERLQAFARERDARQTAQEDRDAQRKEHCRRLMELEDFERRLRFFEAERRMEQRALNVAADMDELRCIV